MSSRIQNAVYLIGQPLLLNAISIPATLFIIRQLGPYRYGEWQVSVSLVMTAAFIANLGLRTMFIRSVAQQPEHASELLAEQMGLRAILGMVAGLIAVLVCVCLRYSSVILECVVLADVGFVIASMATALADVLQGFQCFESYASTSLISGLLLTAASVVAVAFWPGPVGMSFAYLVGPVVNLSLLLRHVKRWLFPVRMRWNLLRYRQLLSEVRTLGLQQFLSALQDRIEQLLVPKFAGVTAFGYYSAGSLPATRLAIFPDGLATAFYPAIARSAQEEKLSGTHNTSRQVTQFFAVSLVVCIPLALMMMFLAYPFSLILERHNAALCNDIIRITIWSVPLMAISLPMSWSLQAIGEQDRAARASMASTVFGLALSYILVSRFGVIGACWSGLGRSLLAVLFLLPTFIRFFPTVLPRVPFGRVLLCALAMALPLWSSTLGRNPGMVRFAAGCVAAVSFYLVALVLFRIITTSDLRAMMRSRRAVSVD